MTEGPVLYDASGFLLRPEIHFNILIKEEKALIANYSEKGLSGASSMILNVLKENTV